MVLLHRLEDTAQHVAALFDRRLGDADRLEAPGQRRVLLEVAGILGPGRGADGPQRAAGQRRLQQVGRIAGALRAAGADQRMRLVDEHDDGRGRSLHLVDDGTQPLLEFALHRGAGLHQPDVERAEPDPLELRRHVARGEPLREAFDHGRLADAGLAGEDRVVLAAAHQHVDDLADFLVAADDRVHLARGGGGRHVVGEAVEGSVAAGRRLAGRRSRRVARGEPGAVHRPQVLLVRLCPDRPGLLQDAIGIELVELLGKLVDGAPQLQRLQPCHQHVAGADLRLAEEQRRIVPAAIEHLGDLRRDVRHLGFVLAEAVDDVGDVLQHLGAVDLVVVERQRQVGAVVGDDGQHPVRQLEVAVASALGVPQRAHEGVVADAVELAGYCFETDVCHGYLPVLRCSGFFPAGATASAERRRCAGSKRASLR